MSKIVTDTSVIINGQLVSQIESGTIRNSEIIIPQAVFDELQSQASTKNENKDSLDLEKIRKTKIIIWKSWIVCNCIQRWKSSYF